MSIRWDSPKEEWDQFLREQNKANKKQKKEKNSSWILDVLLIVLPFGAGVFFLMGRL